MRVRIGCCALLWVKCCIHVVRSQAGAGLTHREVEGFSYGHLAYVVVHLQSGAHAQARVSKAWQDASATSQNCPSKGAARGQMVGYATGSWEVWSSRRLQPADSYRERMGRGRAALAHL
jgi:hypothetical protein